jgi:hypothetical protein
MQGELAKLLGSATLGACLGIVGSIYGKTEPGWAAMTVVGILAAISVFGLIYSGRLGRSDFLDSYEDCQGNCKGKLQRRRLWRLPHDLHKRKGLPVCPSCFKEETGRPVNPFEDRLAYARKGEEYESTPDGKKEASDAAERRRSFLDALRSAEQLGLSPEEKRMVEVSQADPQSPQSPKRDS